MKFNFYFSQNLIVYEDEDYFDFVKSKYYIF